MIFNIKSIRWKSLLKFCSSLLLFTLGLSGIIFFVINYIEKSTQIAQTEKQQRIIDEQQRSIDQLIALARIKEEAEIRKLKGYEIEQRLQQLGELQSQSSQTNIGFQELKDLSQELKAITLQQSELREIQEAKGKTIFFYQDNNYAVRLFLPKDKPKINLFSKTRNKLILEEVNPNQILSSNNKNTYIYNAVTENKTYIISVEFFQSESKVSLIIEENQIE